MKAFLGAAIANVYKYGDTDIFPFPIENRIIYDKKDEICEILIDYCKEFRECFSRNPPSDIRSMVPVHHTGFRWATQLDPIWNVFLLGHILSIAEAIEDARLGTDIVFSYRLDRSSYLSGSLFRTDVNWRHFIEHSRSKLNDYEYVVLCDIADCYSRVSHHKLENNLQIINTPPDTRKLIIEYLSFLTDTRSSGLPIGGPAARMLAELALNNVDQHLHSARIPFSRYADDYHMFAKSKADAYSYLFRISDALDNEGLALQKSKTRIVSRTEYQNITKSLFGDESAHDSPVQRLMSLNLRFDPYAPNAVEKYEELKEQLERIDIIGLLNEQLSQSRIHITVTRRIVSALRSVDNDSQYGAVLSMLDNMDSLFPVAANVLISIDEMFTNFDGAQQEEICQRLREMHESGHEVMGIECFVAYSVRIIRRKRTVANQQWLTNLYSTATSSLIRREIILAFANWGNFPWLSMFRREFEAASPWERRAFVLASFSMGDEGKHWRSHTKRRFDDFERIAQLWGAEIVQRGGGLPL